LFQHARDEVGEAAHCHHIDIAQVRRRLAAVTAEGAEHGAIRQADRHAEVGADAQRLGCTQQFQDREDMTVIDRARDLPVDNVLTITLFKRIGIADLDRHEIRRRRDMPENAHAVAEFGDERHVHAQADAGEVDCSVDDVVEACRGRGRLCFRLHSWFSSVALYARNTRARLAASPNSSSD
jgi:hypothetical protein